MTQPFCLYVTYHRTGKFYVGKGVTEAVLSGKYKGSGTILLDAFKKYPKSEWQTEIVSLHETEDQAYAQEEFYVDDQLLADPQCLNYLRGGKGGHRRKQTAEEIAKRSVGIRLGKADPEYRDHMAALARASSPRAKHGARSLAMWADPEKKAAILAARVGKARAHIRVEVNGNEYRTMTAAAKGLNMTLTRLKKLPTYKELV